MSWIKKAIKFILYLIFVWIILEGVSYVTTYSYYLIDNENKKVNDERRAKMGSFFKHPLFFPPDKNVYAKGRRQYDAFISHRFEQNVQYYGLEGDSYGFIHNGDSDRQPFSDSKAIKVVLLGGSSMAGSGVIQVTD